MFVGLYVRVYFAQIYLFFLRLCLLVISICENSFVFFSSLSKTWTWWTYADWDLRKQFSFVSYIINDWKENFVEFTYSFTLTLIMQKKETNSYRIRRVFVALHALKLTNQNSDSSMCVYHLGCDGRAVKALDLKSNVIFTRRFKSYSQRSLVFPLFLSNDLQWLDQCIYFLG